MRAELFGALPDAPLVLGVGRLHPQKGYDVLIAAAARWRGRRPPPLVAIAGAGPAQQDLEQQIDASGAQVRLLGHRADIADLLAAADIVVATSVWEGQPLLVQEVLRAGVCLVATEVGGVPDIVGDAAVLVPAGQVDAVDDAVQRLLDDPRLRQTHAARGPVQAATWPSEAGALAQVVGVYTDLLAARRGGGRPC